MEIFAVSTSHIENHEDIKVEDEVLNIGAINTRMISSSSVGETTYLDSTILNDIPNPPSFTSGKRHTDVTAQDLAERWFIIIQQATTTLKKTPQNFVRSAILPLTRRY